ncbi:MAG: serine/threonine-protein kinase [Gammaproteobacteria bacterium]|nr:serine/threonine-protein kinase [Gammaproteobacteria bacterium]
MDDDATRVLPPQDGTDQATTIVLTPDETQIADQGLDPPTRFALESAKRQENLQTYQPGTLIKGRFQLVEELGRGGMGVVYSARDLVQEEVGEQNSLIAIKLLSDDFKEHPDALRMLQQETKKARELAHPNIITVYDFDRDEDSVYMTMELMSGHSLKDYLEDHQDREAGLEEVMPIIRGIGEGLRYAHQKNIIHSDLKPANVFLTDSGVKILDFGIARAIMQSEAEAAGRPPGQTKQPTVDVVTATHTQTDGVFALTPSYASLEMFLDQPPDPADDIYAFAVICYQLLTGSKHPYRKRSAKEAFAKGMQPRRIEGLKDQQWNTLVSGLALQRTERSPSVDVFLEGFLPRRREPWKLAAIVSLLLAALATGYFLIRPPEIVEPSLFENPPPAAPLTAAQQTQVEQMLEVAEVHMMVGRLLNPPGSNALDEYQKVLALNPYNRLAIAGLETLLETLLQQARVALAAGDLERAGELLKEGLAIHGDHKGLQLLNEELQTKLQ